MIKEIVVIRLITSYCAIVCHHLEITEFFAISCWYCNCRLYRNRMIIRWRCLRDNRVSFDSCWFQLRSIAELLVVGNFKVCWIRRSKGFCLGFYKLLDLISGHITSLRLRNIHLLLLRLNVRGFRKVSLLLWPSLMMFMMLVILRGGWWLWWWCFIMKLQVINLDIIIIIIVLVWKISSINVWCLKAMSSIVLYLVVTLISMGSITACIITPLLWGSLIIIIVTMIMICVKRRRLIIFRKFFFTKKCFEWSTKLYIIACLPSVCDN